MKTITFITALLLTVSLWSQDLIAVQNGGEPSFYEYLQDAITNSVEGDSIYIPGGSYPGFTLDKKLHLIGTGHVPDSTSATNITQISGQISIVDGADAGTITGMKICTIKFGTATDNQDIDGFSIDRCWIGGCTLGFESPSPVKNIFFRQNIIGYIGGNDSEKIIMFNNNIGRLYNFDNSSFKNNLFLGAYHTCTGGGSGGGAAYVTNSIFYNNYFKNAGYLDYCILSNNIFNNSIHSSITDDCILNNNYADVSNSEVFVNYLSGYFQYDYDFHLLPTSVGVNAGKDGTDIGVYGGSFPWKEGGIPFNPHVQINNISNATDTNGNLQINIQVQAQEK